MRGTLDGGARPQKVHARRYRRVARAEKKTVRCDALHKEGFVYWLSCDPWGNIGVPAMKRDLQTIHEHKDRRNRLWIVLFVIAVVGLVLSDPFIMQVR